jgi:hypothetical protein
VISSVDSGLNRLKSYRFEVQEEEEPLTASERCLPRARHRQKLQIRAWLKSVSL